MAPEPALEIWLRSRKAVRYLSADLYMHRVMQKIDLRKTDFPDNYFDGIVCNHVLEHIDDDRLAMAELRRILKPVGWAILQVPISYLLGKTIEDPGVKTADEREKRFGQHDHVRIYGPDYVARLEGVGFAVEQFRWWEADTGFGGRDNKFGLLPEEVLFVARK